MQGALPESTPDTEVMRELAVWTPPPASDESRERLLAAVRVELACRARRHARQAQPRLTLPESSRRRWPLMAMVSTLLVAVGASVWLGTVTVSADEALARAEHAEVRQWLATPQPIVYQRIELRVASRGLHRDARWESWSESSGKVRRFATEQPVQRSIVTRYLDTLARNGLDQGPPLSAAAFVRWRSQLPASADRKEHVESVHTPDMGLALRIHLHWLRPQPPGGIVDASVLLRTSDWHPVEQMLQVQTSDGEIERFDLTEHHAAVVSRDALSGSSIEDAFTTPSPKVAPAAAVATVSTADLDDVETQALFALHQLHADRGEQIEVIRRAQHVEIRGVVDSADRLAAIAGALSHIPHTRFSVVQADRAASVHAIALDQAAIAPPRPARGEPVTADAAVDPPLWRFIDAYLRASAAHDPLPPDDPTARARAVNVFVQDVNGDAESAVAEAWALRRLAERYPPETRADLAEPSRRRLQEMTHDHLAAIRGGIVRLRRALEPVEAAARGPRDRAAADPDRDAPPPAASEPRRLSEPQVFLAVIDVERRLADLVVSDRRVADAADGADDDDAGLGALTRLVSSLTRLEQNLQRLIEQG
jgi:hypothetical protein